MEKTIKVIHEMRRKGVISNYAIGGATALLFYTEPALTFDLDVFVFLPTTENRQRIISLNPIYDYLTKKGYKVEKEHIIVEGIPVQFIPAYNSLVEEAVNKARNKNYKQLKARVILLEYLVAMMIDTGRPKDWARVSELLKIENLDKTKFAKILKQYNLEKKLEGKLGKS